MFLFWTALIVAFDQATKLWAMNAFTPGGPEMPVALGVSFTYVRNPGAAFGMFRDLAVPLGPVTLDGTLLLGLVSAAVATGIVVYLARNGHELPRRVAAALTLILGGAVGNMIDRLWRGYVVDFIHFQQGSFDFAVFNVADSAVVAGAGLLMLAAFLPSSRMPAPGDPRPDGALPGAGRPAPDAAPGDAPPEDAPEGARDEEPALQRSGSRFDRTPDHRREFDEPDLEGIELDARR